MTTFNTASSLICFKNGYSYVTIPVQLVASNDTDGSELIQECQVGPLPDFAVHGTVGLRPNNAHTVKIYSIAQDKKKEQLKMPSGPDFNFTGLMEANIGTAVEVMLSQTASSSSWGTNTQYCVEGIVKLVQGPESGTKLAVIETADKTEKVIDCSRIIQLNLCKDFQSYEQKIRSLLVRYSVRNCGEEKSYVGATLSYLTKGLTWAPSYTILLNTEEKVMTLEGKACLLCDLASFNGGMIKDVWLVAGQPNMEFKHIADPLASGVSAENFINQLINNEKGLARGAADQLFGNNAPAQLMAQSYQMGGNCGFGFGGNSRRSSVNVDEDNDKIEGETVQDFYHYQLRNVPINFKQPISLPFIEACANIEYEDIYYFDLNKKLLQKKKPCGDEGMIKAMHAVTFKNISGKPLTTAPVSVFSEGTTTEDSGDDSNKFMVQTTMKFTAQNESATVEITDALDVDAKFITETEKERKTELITEGTFGGFFKSGPKSKYADSIQKNAKVVINNNKNEEVNCKIEYLLYGHMEHSKPDPIEKIEKGSQHQRYGLNPTTKYVWKMKIPSKGKSDLIFKYCIKEWSK